MENSDLIILAKFVMKEEGNLYLISMLFILLLIISLKRKKERKKLIRLFTSATIPDQ